MRPDARWQQPLQRWPLGSAALAAFVISLLGSGLSAGDDTYIYMTYARSLIETGSYAYNGVASSGATSPGWLLLGALASALAGLDVWTWKLLGATLFAAAFSLIARMVSVRSLWFWCLLLNPLTLRWSATGMENPLTLLYVAGLFLLARDRPGPALAFVAPLALLVRPELVLLSGLLLAGQAGRLAASPRAWIAGLAGVALVLLTCLAMGAPLLAQTSSAKSALLGQADPAYALTTLIRIFAVSGALIFIAVPACLLSGRLSWQTPAWRALWLPAALAMLALSAWLARADFLISTRYETSLFLPLLLAGVLVLQPVASRSRLLTTLAGLTLVLSLLMFGYFQPLRTLDETVTLRPFAQAARQIVARAPGRVAISEVGIFAYYSRLPLIDIFGLTSADALAFHDRQGVRPSAGQDSLELFLEQSGAAYYVETFGGARPLRGHRLRFTPLLETVVRRNNMSSGTPAEAVWRLYRVSRQGEAS